MSAKLSANPLKGMMDLHPLEMQKHVFVQSGIERVAHAFCYEAYSLAILEARETFIHQDSTELIAEQAYAFTDRAGREVLLRPEITPVLARMVAKESGRYTLPLRWYTVGNCYRYERPQKGRLREFAQLNFDVMGKQHILYDIEMFKLIVALMETFHVPEAAYRIRYNHRTYVEALLAVQGMDAANRQAFYTLIDRKHKLDEAKFNEEVERTFKSLAEREFVRRYVEADSVDALLTARVRNSTVLTDVHRAGLENFEALETGLRATNFKQRPVFDPTIVRGIDYYTGVVFEVFATGKGMGRSLFGGGRYDSLVGNYGVKPMSAVGFGMGIHIFILFLEQVGVPLATQDASKTLYLAPLVEKVLAPAFTIAETLRAQGNEVCLGLPAAFNTHFDKARKQGYGHVAALGENELETKILRFKRVCSLTDKQSLNLTDILK